ncbi:BBP7 family outer membrane beta-barrel protein [Novipirellula sp. SH528]|uniref:BBP7 family outer membrane beta-barrel protein n=1 Tax=Novipirellula sp. SH528 TaxID=3454466 RepID=UPI003FA17B01
MTIALLAMVIVFVESSVIYAADSPTHISDAAAPQSPRKMTWRPVTGKQAKSDASSVVKLASGESESPTKQAAVTPVSYDFYDSLLGVPLQYDEGFAIEPTACDSGSCQGCDACDSIGIANSRNLFWIRAEYLSWSLDGISLPPLVTTSPSGTTPENTGILNRPETTILFGGDEILDSLRSGARISVGRIDSNRNGGIELSALGVFSDDESFGSNSSLLARPVFNTQTGAEDAMLIAHPDFLSGSVRVQVENELYAFDVLRRQRLASTACDRLDLLIGYRHARLDEMLRIDQSSTYTAPRGQIISGTSVVLFDEFDVENQFNGAEIGLNYRRTSGTWTLATLLKVGLGVNRAEVTIDGGTTNTVPGSGSASFTGGLLAQQTNIGQYDDSQFTVIPEVGLTLSKRIDDFVELSIGYSLLYWSDAMRVADVIDRSVSQFPPEPPSGSGNPRFNFVTDDFIAHGLTTGVKFSF